MSWFTDLLLLNAQRTLRRFRPPGGTLPLCFVFAIAAFSAPPWGQARNARPALTLQGKLLSVLGSGPVLRTHRKEYSLAAQTSYLFHTLQDKRLQSREVRLEGTIRHDGTFEVTRLFTLHGGKLYRVRYFCELCNIQALEPGDCVCCQQPTELQEIPVTKTEK